MSTSLTEYLSNKLDKLNNTDQDWVTFVIDHIDVIRENSTTISIDASTRDRYAYKFEHFMRDNGCSSNIVWIARMLNDVTMYEDFTKHDTIVIPSISHINALYRNYKLSTNLT